MIGAVSDPAVEPLDLPAGYGTPEATLHFGGVRARLEQAKCYWLATVRPDGRPHTMPVDGLWRDDAWFFGGSPDTVKHRNLQANPRAVIHLEDADRAVIVEGVCEWLHPQPELARRLAAMSQEKYGYAPDSAGYTDQGLWRLRPERVLGWELFPRDATRFVFA
jgi:hypothetical protein